ncbi:MAG: hypothetical protein NXH74_04540 [Rhodobacteraceae bacterium]|jgi:hypothetical protein|nr:hypothetical protein [Paracoccaceae bacterium]
MIRELDARMIDAHEARDLGALIQLYSQAADMVNDVDAACFYLTHAYVFALEAGAAQAASLRDRLVAQGREE